MPETSVSIDPSQISVHPSDRPTADEIPTTVEREKSAAEVAREKEVDLFADDGSLLIHKTNAVSVPSILDEGILSLSAQARRDGGKPAKRLLPVGHSPVLQTINPSSRDYVSHYDQRVMEKDSWKYTLLNTVGISLVLNPKMGRNATTQVFSEYKGWPGESVTRSVAPDNIIGIIADPKFSDEMTVEDLISYYIEGISVDRDFMFQGEKGIDNLVWALRAMMVGSPRIINSKIPLSDLSQHTIDRKSSTLSSSGFIESREFELEEQLPLLEKIRDKAAMYELQLHNLTIRAKKANISPEDYYDIYIDNNTINPYLNPAKEFNEAKNAFIKYAATLFKLYLRKNLDIKTEDITMKNVLTLLGEKHQIPIYKINKDRTDYDVMWPEKDQDLASDKVS